MCLGGKRFLSTSTGNGISSGAVPAIGSFGEQNFLRHSHRLVAFPRHLGKRRDFASFLAEKIRNVAIIAHVDHGKTTLMDQMLQQSGTMQMSEGERVMDSNALEKERGITIMSKQTSMLWKDVKVNLVDTPGHGDFGGEVERVLSMVDGVVILVDALEGVMSQTKFVLSKALKAGLQPIVVLNKMDRSEASRVEEVKEEIFELFIALEASEKQMEYPTLYAAAREGWVIANETDPKTDVSALFNAILAHIPPPDAKQEDSSFRMLVTSLETDQFLGRILTGKVQSGKAIVGNTLKIIDMNGGMIETGKLVKVIARNGLDKVVLEEAVAGDIVGLAGYPAATVTSTVCSVEVNDPLKAIPIDPPVLFIQVLPNNSPLSGREGTQSTYPQIRKRLEKEVENNVSVSLRKAVDSKDALELCGRGELQLGIIIENMRREGFEFAISPPQVVIKMEGDKKYEPMEEVIIDTDNQYIGSIMEKLVNSRQAEMIEMKQLGTKTRMVFHCLSRALVGFRNELVMETRGTAVYNHIFHSYVLAKGAMASARKGSLVSTDAGIATAYALESIEPRGILFIGPQTQVYTGMVIGESNRDLDLDVNPCKTKQLTNIRTTSKDEYFRLTPPRKLTLEEYMAYMRSDELLEITPQNFRLRKLHLSPNQRSNKRIK